MGHALAVAVVTACLFALALWFGWWLFLSPADEYDWRSGPPFTIRDRRDFGIMVVTVVAIIGGGVLYAAYRAAVVICS